MMFALLRTISMDILRVLLLIVVVTVLVLLKVGSGSILRRVSLKLLDLDASASFTH